MRKRPKIRLAVEVEFQSVFGIVNDEATQSTACQMISNLPFQARPEATFQVSADRVDCFFATHGPMLYRDTIYVKSRHPKRAPRIRGIAFRLHEKR